MSSITEPVLSLTTRFFTSFRMTEGEGLRVTKRRVQDDRSHCRVNRSNIHDYEVP